jgi:plastocyanin
MRKLTLALALLALTPFALGACGGDDDDEGDSASETTAAETTEDTGGDDAGGGGSVTITADADGNLAYTEDAVSAPAGPVTVEFDNPASIGHDVVVEDDGGEELLRTEVITDSTSTASGELEPGDYTFYCSVAGHREAGMEGTLTAE